MLDLVTEILRRTAAGETVALATLVRARGSTPQKTGAAMLVLASGQTLGTLGGGCVEAEARSRCLEALTAQTPSQQPQLLSFKLDHDYGWDDGLVCGGIMDIAISTYSPSSDLAPLQQLTSDLAARKTAHFTVPDPDAGSSYTLRFDPAPRLIIAGAGHVAFSLAQVAAPAGFELTVIDDRPDIVTPARFPTATRIAADIAGELSRLPIDPDTYIVIVTRGHKHDAQALHAVVQSPAKYIGLIGSKRKIRTIFAELHAMGIPREKLLAVHAPIGLDLGAISPHEIAISIAAELLAVRYGRDGTAMKMQVDEVETWLDRSILGDQAASD